jgi:hypothetical protein
MARSAAASIFTAFSLSAFTNFRTQSTVPFEGRLSRQPDRAWLSRMGLIGFGSVWALLAAVVSLLAR